MTAGLVALWAWLAELMASAADAELAVIVGEVAAWLCAALVIATVAFDARVGLDAVWLWFALAIATEALAATVGLEAVCALVAELMPIEARNTSEGEVALWLWRAEAGAMATPVPVETA